MMRMQVKKQKKTSKSRKGGSPLLKKKRKKNNVLLKKFSYKYSIPKLYRMPVGNEFKDMIQVLID